MQLKMNGAEILLECLAKEKVETIFGYPGGALLPLFDKINQQKKIRHILVRHEQAAALAADGFSRASGKVGVCLATSGPGATNLVTGIANAFLDSVPVVAITGQVATHLIGTDAFQEVDITGICQPICKQTFQVLDAKEIPEIVAQAFHIAASGRPGPVLIDLPKDVQEQSVDKFKFAKKIDLPGFKPNLLGNEHQIKKAKKLIENSQRPVVLAGHGVVLSGAESEFRQFVEKVEIPTLTTLLAIGLLEKNHALNFGMLGMHGQLAANFAVHHADLVIGIGLRFDDRILGDPKDFAPEAKVIHVDIDRAEIGKNRACDVPIVGDAKLVLQEILKGLASKKHQEWLAQVHSWKEQKDQVKESRVKGKNEKISARDAVQLISKLTGGQAIVAADVGQNQMWVANFYDFANPRKHLSSGGLGDMGYSIPAAMGAKVAEKEQVVLAICGDGGFQMNGQELATLMQDNIGVKIVILNNGFLGMVRQWQELFYRKNYSFTNLLNPDFCKFAESFGVPAWRCETLQDLQKNFQQALDTDGPALVEVIVQNEENVFPMVSPGQSLKKTRLG